MLLLLALLGDKWILLIVRDMMFGNRGHFHDLLNKPEPMKVMARKAKG